MTVVKLRPALAEIKSLLSADKDFLKPLVRTVLQEVLEAEMTEALGAAKGERAEARLGYRSGHYSRVLMAGPADFIMPLKQATTTIPIVMFAPGVDPVRYGFAAHQSKWKAHNRACTAPSNSSHR